jgi:hypothetical protein
MSALFTLSAGKPYAARKPLTSAINWEASPAWANALSAPVAKAGKRKKNVRIMWEILFIGPKPGTYFISNSCLSTEIRKITYSNAQVFLEYIANHIPIHSRTVLLPSKFQ